MDETRRMALTGIEMLERELVVRDFLEVLNDGSLNDLLPFLTEDVRYRPTPRQEVCGRARLVEMIDDIRCTFAEWRVCPVHIAVSGDVVLTEQALRLALPGAEPAWAFGFASFHLEGFRISAWHQVHA